MAVRSFQNQDFHDTIIKTLKEIYSRRKDTIEVYINPGQEKNAALHGIYPDIIVKNQRGYLIFEVETLDSVTEDESNEWSNISTLGTFYLVVPDSYQEDATKLLVKHLLRKTIIITYKLVESKLVFSKLP
jgi:hypothetical protein